MEKSKEINYKKRIDERDTTQITGIVDKVAGFYKNVILKILWLCIQNPNESLKSSLDYQ